MKTNNVSPEYACSYCEQQSEVVGVVQKETHYYSVDLNTKQWEDLDGSEGVESQKFFCINCEETLNEEINI